MKCLIIGGSKFVVSPVARSITQKDGEAFVFGQEYCEKTLPEKAKMLNGDRRDPVALKEAYKTAKFDVVIDAGSSEESEAKAVLEAIDGFEGRFVYTSNTNIYKAHAIVHKTEKPEPYEPCPISESAALRTTLAKNEKTHERPAVEQMYLNELKDASVVRLPPLYGAEDTQRRFFPQMIRMLDKRPNILVGESQAKWKWTHGYIENIADAIQLVATSELKEARLFNLGEKMTPSVLERMNHIATIFEWDGELIVIPDEFLPKYMRTPGDFDQDIVYDTNLIRHDLEYNEIADYYEGMHTAIEWYAAHPPLSFKGHQFSYEAEEKALDLYYSTKNSATPAS